MSYKSSIKFWLPNNQTWLITSNMELDALRDAVKKSVLEELKKLYNNPKFSPEVEKFMHFGSATDGHMGVWIDYQTTDAILPKKNSAEQMLPGHYEAYIYAIHCNNRRGACYVKNCDFYELDSAPAGHEKNCSVCFRCQNPVIQAVLRGIENVRKG